MIDSRNDICLVAVIFFCLVSSFVFLFVFFYESFFLWPKFKHALETVMYPLRGVFQLG